MSSRLPADLHLAWRDNHHDLLDRDHAREPSIFAFIVADKLHSCASELCSRLVSPFVQHAPLILRFVPSDCLQVPNYVGFPVSSISYRESGAESSLGRIALAVMPRPRDKSRSICNQAYASAGLNVISAAVGGAMGVQHLPVCGFYCIAGVTNLWNTEGAPGGVVWLDGQPLWAINARLESASYAARKTADGTMAFALVARPQGSTPTIGARGTAKVQGRWAPLGYAMLRRPISALRQTIGL